MVSVIITYITISLSLIVLRNHYFHNTILYDNPYYIYGVWLILIVSIYRLIKIFKNNA